MLDSWVGSFRSVTITRSAGIAVSRALQELGVSWAIFRHEFLGLLNQVFPEHCDENERHVAAEFAAADSDGSDGISLSEFIGYYSRLKQLYADNEQLGVLRVARMPTCETARVHQRSSPPTQSTQACCARANAPETNGTMLQAAREPQWRVAFRPADDRRPPG